MDINNIIEESLKLPINIDSEAFKKLNNVKITPTDVAKVLYHLYKDKFICVGTKYKGEFYHFKNHRYVKIDGNSVIRKKLIDTIIPVYVNFVKTKITKNKELNHIDTVNIKKITDVITKLGTTSFKNNVMVESLDEFYQSDSVKKFINKLDEQHYLLGCENGVYDLSKGIFRDGRPKDYITFSTKLNYKEYNWDDDVVIEIMDFINKVFVDVEQREYVLHVLASCLSGVNKHEHFYIFEGVGSNGKSKLIELFERVLGDYAGKLPISLLTKKRNSSSNASPEVSRTKGLRFICLQEPDEDTTINVGLMKELTGGDKIQARALFEMPIEFKPQFKMILTCNHLPKLPFNDEGTWRRIRQIKFKSRFVDDITKFSNEKTHNYFEKDVELSNKFNEWTEPFLWILIQYYTKYRDNGYTIYEPKCVTETTDMYRQDMDNLSSFVGENLEQTNNSGDILLFSDLYKKYKTWHLDSNMSNKMKSSKDFMRYITHIDRLGEFENKTKKQWVGIRLVKSMENCICD